MKMCEEHWQQMREKVQTLGLWQFVSSSGEEALQKEAANVESAQSGERPEPQNWDPLMSMNINFMQRAAEIVGVLLFEARSSVEDGMPENGGHYCPLCVARRVYDLHVEEKCNVSGCKIQITPETVPFDVNWIEGCGSVMLEYAVEKGLVQRQ